MTTRSEEYDIYAKLRASGQIPQEWTFDDYLLEVINLLRGYLVEMNK
jgi:hypothetical protein